MRAVLWLLVVAQGCHRVDLQWENMPTKQGWPDGWDSFLVGENAVALTTDEGKLPSNTPPRPLPAAFKLPREVTHGAVQTQGPRRG